MTEQQTRTFNQRLDEARDEIGLVIGKDAAGHYGKYTSLASVLKAVDRPLRKHGLIRRDWIDTDGNLVVSVELRDYEVTDFGECRAVFPLPWGQPPEKIGAAISYFRRYGLGVLIGFATDGDVDSYEYQDAVREERNQGRSDTKAPTAASANPWEQKLAEFDAEAVENAMAQLGFDDNRPVTKRRFDAIVDVLNA